MTNYERFEKDFNETYTSIYDFIENDTNIGKEPLKFEEKENNDKIYHDSYGNEDSVLERVFYFPDYDVYVKFEGTRQSYNGEEWDSMREVKPTQRIINTFE
jgi:hypothetical protein